MALGRNVLSLNVEAPRSRRRRARPEQDLQRAAMKLLRSILPKNAFLFHVPNGGVRSPIEAAILNGLGVRAGFPDLGIIWTGRIFTIELKAPENRSGLSIDQRQVHAELREAGARVEVARTLEEIVAHLVDFGIPLKPHWMVENCRERQQRDDGVLDIAKMPGFLKEGRPGAT